jgi:hypothetical protein
MYNTKEEEAEKPANDFAKESSDGSAHGVEFYDPRVRHPFNNAM